MYSSKEGNCVSFSQLIGRTDIFMQVGISLYFGKDLLRDWYPVTYTAVDVKYVRCSESNRTQLVFTMSLNCAVSLNYIKQVRAIQTGEDSSRCVPRWEAVM